MKQYNLKAKLYIVLKHWNDNLEDVLKYLNTYLNKKKLERDY